MIMAIQGSRNADDYNVFLRAMRYALGKMAKDDEFFYVYSAGPAKINSMATEFLNVSERTLKTMGIKAQLRRVTPGWIKDNIDSIDYIAFLSKPEEPLSDLVAFAESKNAEISVYRF
jgi:hypothetical protein